MPRERKSARLHWRERKDGKSVWEIRDGYARISTGTVSRDDAEKFLAQYLERKHRPSGPTAPQDLTISMALTIYAEEHAVSVADPGRIGYAIEALDRFWANSTVGEITGNTCRAYQRSRKKRDGTPVSPGTIRRELNVLQAAINHCHREGYLTTAPKVVLPKKPDSKDRYLTRQEAAWLLRAARSLKKDGRHLADFIQHGLYAGSRKATILAMHIDTPSTFGGHVDTRNGILYRKPQGKVMTKKRQGTARVPARYLAQLRRMAANGRLYVVERQIVRRGVLRREMVANIRKGWDGAIKAAPILAAKHGIAIDLSDVTPHVLKHTAITWALQKGATIWDAAGYFDTSAETIQKTYGHHCPDHQSSVLAAIDRRA